MACDFKERSQSLQSNGHPSWKSGAVHVDIDAFDVSMDIGHWQTKSAKGTADLRQRAAGPTDSKEYVYSTIQPFSRPPPTALSKLITEIRGVLGEAQSSRIILLGLFTLISICVLLIWSQTTDSMALTAYSTLLLFDLLSLGTSLVSIWVSKQKTSSAYSFGYERFEVLAVFTSTMLASFSAIFIIKECTERIFSQPEIHTGRLMLGAALGFLCHMVVTYGNRNHALSHVSTSSKSSWLQEHFADICKSFCTVVPGLNHLLLPRINPFALVGFGGATALTVADFLIDVNNYHSADTWASYAIAFMLFGTMFPLSVYSGTILLQTTPAHLLGQLDKCLREASTLDGVLEFRNEHFWTLSFGRLAGSLHVRVRRDADEQLVLAHVTNKLSHLVSPLTIQIIKDDWTRVSSISSFSSGHLDNKLTPPTPLPSQYSSAALTKTSHHIPASSVQHLLQQKRLGPVDSVRHPRASSTPFGTPSKDSGISLNMSEPSPILPYIGGGASQSRRAFGETKSKGILRNAPYVNIPLESNYNQAPSWNKHSQEIHPSNSVTVDLSKDRNTPLLSEKQYRGGSSAHR